MEVNTIRLGINVIRLLFEVIRIIKIIVTKNLQFVFNATVALEGQNIYNSIKSL